MARRTHRAGGSESSVYSLQLKIGGFVAGLLLAACVSLAWVAERHERDALEVAVTDRGRSLTASLAGAAEAPMRALSRGMVVSEGGLSRLVAAAAASEGVVAARLLDRDGKIVASSVASEAGRPGRSQTRGGSDGEIGIRAERADGRLRFAVPIRTATSAIGEAQTEVDLAVVVERLLAGQRRQFALAAIGVFLLGVLATAILVSRLAGPLKRLRAGVEEVSAGNVMVRVPPTSRDEVGDLTRAFNEMGDALAQKQRVQRAFGRYVDDYVLDQLLESADGEEQAGVERETTIFFVDIRSFTRLSEGMTAPQVVALLNEIFQVISDPILEHGGTIDKFIGDSVMVYFGAPISHPDHPQRAVRAAVQIVEAIADRNRRAESDEGTDFVPVEIGIGIHLGNVVVGNIGSDRRSDFTAVGDAVNVAHRLEKLAAPGEILVSEAVQRRVRGAVRMRFEGERMLSGREEPVHVYAVEGSGEKVSKESRV